MPGYNLLINGVCRQCKINNDTLRVKLKIRRCKKNIKQIRRADEDRIYEWIEDKLSSFNTKGDVDFFVDFIEGHYGNVIGELLRELVEIRQKEIQLCSLIKSNGLE
jgi:hypothetical protein